MRIQKGRVKYKDRNDIICVYGVTDTGKTYYFLNSDGKSFENGNYVASTELVESIDPMYKASNVGVVDFEGNEVIPCENKGIKSITDDVILVEKAVPTTESVLQAIERRKDSLYAAQLVSTPAQIKDNIYHEMGNDGRFLFNDQFAEATVYDINGNNLVNGEVYSFIAINNDRLYLSKNLPESPVVQLALGENKEEEAILGQHVQDEAVKSSSLESSVDANEEKVKLDINDVNVPIDVVESALDGQAIESEHNVIQDNFDVDTHTALENVNEGLELPSSADFMAANDVGIPVVHENEVPISETSDEVSTEKVNTGLNADESVEEVVETPVEDKTSVEEIVVEEKEEIDEEKEEPLVEEDIQTLLDETSIDLFGATPLQVDSIVKGNVTDDLDNYTFAISESTNSDNLFDDVAKSLSDLIRQVREQRATIANYEEVINGLNADMSELQGKSTAFEHRNVELSDRNRVLENAIIKLKTRTEMLASKLHEKDDIIENQKRELKELREQFAGKDQLLSLLRDAQALVNDTNTADDIDDYSYIKAA